MRVTIPLAALALLVGCTADLDVAGKAWTKAGTGYAQLTADEMACAREATDAGGTAGFFVGGVADALRNAIAESARRDAYERCMIGKGYRPAG